jgi:hypothetical protein
MQIHRTPRTPACKIPRAEMKPVREKLGFGKSQRSESKLLFPKRMNYNNYKKWLIR